MLSKPCLICETVIIKAQNVSLKAWIERTKYCTKECYYQSKAGKAPWNKGIKEPGKRNAGNFKKGHSTWNKGLKGHCAGERNSHWKGGITPINEKIRKSPEYKAWRTQVFERDNYTCQICEVRGGVILNADHIKPFATHPELRFDLSNGRTLCLECHKATPTYLNRWIKAYA